MVVLRRRLVCCTWNREISNSIDFDQPQDRIMTYNGLESCILNANSYEEESADEDNSSCSSSNIASGSFCSQWTVTKRDEQKPEEWEYSESPRQLVTSQKPLCMVQFSDLEIMKEKFAKLLLGDDTTGGRQGLSSALALSNAITKLAGTVFGELWKLEPLPEEKKSKWRIEMEWLLSPTNYMVQLVPAKQYCTNGRTLEIMTPKARGDVHMNLPALRKLDSMLLETLDAMTYTEFWYKEGGSRAEGRGKCAKQSKRWWLPMPRVPIGGLSSGQRKKLMNQATLVHQIFKAAKLINESVLVEMPIPNIISEALPKSGKASLGDDLYRMLNTVSSSAVGMLNCLNLKSEHTALDTINRLEAAIYAWKQKVLEHPGRTSWSFKDHISELEKTELMINRGEALLQQIRIGFPNLPQTFLDVMKIQYGKDVGHAILEAYSRVIGNLAFSILTRIGDIAEEDVLSDPNSPMATNSLPAAGMSRHTLIDEGKESSHTSSIVDEPKTSSMSRSPGCCIGKEACFMSPAD